jgi:hypothetical protein
MSEMDYTYAERWGRTGYKYATPIDESVADGVVDALAVDATYLEALTDKFKDDAEYIAGLIAGLVADNSYPEKLADYLSTDAEYLAGVIAAFVADATYPAALIAAFVADATYPAALGDALGADTDFLEDIAEALAINNAFLDAVKAQANPIWWVDTAISAEAANVITVTFTQLGVDGQEETGRAQRFTLKFFKDALPTDVTELTANAGLQTDLTWELTAGNVLSEVTANEEYVVMSDSFTGTIVLVLDDSIGDGSYHQFAVLTNEVTGECHVADCLFADDTP